MDKQIYNFLKVLKTAFTSEAYRLDEPDWEAMAKLASGQSVAPLFNEGAAFYDGIDSELSQRMFSSSVMQLSAQALRTEEFLCAYDTIAKAGVYPIVVKGLICRYTYGDLGDHRPSGDEDIYIKKEDFPTVMEALRGLGYEPEEHEITPKLLDVIQEISFKSPSGLKIEVHINLFGKETGVRRSLNGYFENAFETAEEIEVDGHKLYTLDWTLNYLFLFMHLYKHFTFSGVGVRQVIDMGFFHKMFKDRIDIDAVEKAICEIKADRLYADTVEIARMLGFDVDTRLKGKDPRLLLEDMADGGVFGNISAERSQSSLVLLSAMNGNEGKPNLMKMLFPPVEMLVVGHPVLSDKPWLLPFIWVKRWFKFIGKLFTNKKGLGYAGESLELGKHRLELIKEYGLIE